MWGESVLYNFEVKEIDKDTSLSMVKKYHYSNTLPKLNKHFIGFYLEDKLVGLVTLGWGTQPLNTIKKIFPSLETKDYYEIGKMCMTEDMPRNSESQMLSKLCDFIKKNYKNIKVLFTWADGMLGKCGYVYQASGFLYAGYTITDIYMKDGVKIHPRQMRKVLPIDKDDKRIGIRPNKKQLLEYGIDRYKGKQFKYLKFLCSKVEKKKLIKESKIELNFKYPKEKDLCWKKYELKNDLWVECGKPPYITDTRFLEDDLQMNIFDFIEEE